MESFKSSAFLNFLIRLFQASYQDCSLCTAQAPKRYSSFLLIILTTSLLKVFALCENEVNVLKLIKWLHII